MKVVSINKNPKPDPVKELSKVLLDKWKRKYRERADRKRNKNDK